MIIADDEEEDNKTKTKLDFGPEMTLLDEMEDFPDKGHLYSVQAADKAVSKLAEAELLRKVLPDVLAGNFSRIRSVAVLSASVDVPHRLLPKSF